MACLTLKTHCSCLKGYWKDSIMDRKQHFTKLNSHLCTGSQYKNLTARVISLKCFNCLKGLMIKVFFHERYISFLTHELL